MITDHREEQRHRIYLPVSCRSATQSFIPGWILTKDISQTGIRLQTDSALAKGMPLTIEIEVPGRLFLLSATGRIKWIENIPHSSQKPFSPTKEIGIEISFSESMDSEIWDKIIRQSDNVPPLRMTT